MSTTTFPNSNQRNHKNYPIYNQKKTIDNSNIKSVTKKTKHDTIPFWKLQGDEFIETYEDLTGNSTIKKLNSIQFVVRGRPKPLQRHRRAVSHFYNPSAEAQSSFREVVDSFITGVKKHHSKTLFGEKDFLCMHLNFRLRRPRHHFIGSKPPSPTSNTNRLKKTSPKIFPGDRTDIDNLAKFVMDSLIGIVYEDDKQIVSLSCNKIYDFEGSCEGATEVWVGIMKEDDIQRSFISSKF